MEALDADTCDYCWKYSCSLLLAVVDIGVAAATVGVVDEAERRVVQLKETNDQSNEL